MSWFRNILQGATSSSSKANEGSDDDPFSSSSSLSRRGGRGAFRYGQGKEANQESSHGKGGYGRQFSVEGEELKEATIIQDLTESLVHETTRIRRKIQVEMQKIY